MAMTAPGQTAGVSVLLDPMIEDLGIGRTQVSTAYLVGTLCGASAMPFVGRAVDRYGPRRVMLAVAAVFGTVLLALSFVSGIIGLTAGFVGIRMAGQGALGLVATTTVAYWFHRRRGLALGITSAVGTAGISLAPVAVERLVAEVGWRAAWAVEGLAVWAVVVPLALFGLRDRPSDVGQHVDGVAPPEDGNDHDKATGRPLRHAARTGMFWAIALCMASSAMLTTGLNFHQIDLLGERGLSPVEAAANFLPQTVAALLATLAAGALLDRASPRIVLVASMLTLAGAVAAAGVVRPGWTALAFGLALGSANGLLRAVESAAYPLYFGTAHLGAIRGVSYTVSVGASALGPVAVALGHHATGSYGPALLLFALIPFCAAALVLLAREPGEPSAPAPSEERSRKA
ncbi:MFS transporter [Streptomyces sp. OF8]|uniref:MFS transporter n=2 Tax=Streptomyces alkaliterrae TaxID=2213162 RepID=A0A5P0YXM5_9ACTN|nr:MFS transporter [Streptomyces alkaliterrae]MQS04740.1 MFS transporter [Streptomyces alkaliterrae]